MSDQLRAVNTALRQIQNSLSTGNEKIEQYLKPLQIAVDRANGDGKNGALSKAFDNIKVFFGKNLEGRSELKKKLKANVAKVAVESAETAALINGLVKLADRLQAKTSAAFATTVPPVDLFDCIRRRTHARNDQLAAFVAASTDPVRDLVAVPAARRVSPLMYAVACHNTSAVKTMLAGIPPSVTNVGFADCLLTHPQHGRGDPTCTDEIKEIVTLLSGGNRLKFSRNVPCAVHEGLQAIVDQYTQ